MKYTIVTAYNTEDLTRKVQDKLDKGWRPIGGVALLANCFAQSLVRGKPLDIVTI